MKRSCKVHILCLVFCSRYYGCLTNYLKVEWWKRPFVMFTDSRGQEFCQGAAGAACLCSMRSGTSAGGLESWGWNPLRTPTPSCLAADSGCWPETQFFSTQTFPCGFSVRVGLEFLVTWQLSSKGKCSQRGSQEVVMSPMNLPCKLCIIISTAFHS